MSTSRDNFGDVPTRVLFWDVAKALAIFCVIWQHTVCNLSAELSLGLTDPVSSIVLPFHMPMFMFISGYFAFSSLSKAPMSVVSRKAKQLLLPSITWFLILSALALAFKRNLSAERLRDIVMTLPQSYWFLKSLFLCYLLTIIGTGLYRWKRWSVLLYAVLLCCMAEYLNYVATISMYPFFLLGLLCNKFRDSVFKRQLWLFAGGLLIFVGVLTMYHTNDYNIYSHPFEFSIGGVKTLTLRIIAGLSGSVAIVLFLKWLVDRCKSFRIIRLAGHVGTLTLGIYCIQAIFAEGLFKSFTGLTRGMSPSIYFYVLTPIASLAVVVISVLIINAIKRNRTLRLLLLGEN